MILRWDRLPSHHSSVAYAHDAWKSKSTLWGRGSRVAVHWSLSLLSLTSQQAVFEFQNSWNSHIYTPFAHTHFSSCNKRTSSTCVHVYASPDWPCICACTLISIPARVLIPYPSNRKWYAGCVIQTAVTCAGSDSSCCDMYSVLS